VAVLAILLSMTGCNSSHVVTAVDEMQVTDLRRQELAEEIAAGREIIISSVEMPPNMASEWHWHPSESCHYYVEGRVQIEFRELPTVVSVPGQVGHVPHRAVHRAVTGAEGARLIIFRVHESGEPVRHLEGYEH
jgi:quercetin dioxygenase-like cupin family protein